MRHQRVSVIRSEESHFAVFRKTFLSFRISKTRLSGAICEFQLCRKGLINAHIVIVIAFQK